MRTPSLEHDHGQIRIKQSFDPNELGQRQLRLALEHSATVHSHDGASEGVPIEMAQMEELEVETVSVR